VAEARHFCPDCGNIEIQVNRKFVLLSEEEDTGATAACPNCGWSGPLSKAIGAVSSEQFWDFRRVAEVLMRVVSKSAAGPFVQVMEFVGLLPKRMGVVEYAKQAEYRGSDPSNDDALLGKFKEYNLLVEQAQDSVVRAMLEGALTFGFAEAEKWHRVHAAATNVPVSPILDTDREFGGEKN
jgi:predicted RNA-binding Zn-ribbon protein involved in translation (DUF1610 family)